MIAEFFKAEKIYKFDLPYRPTFVHAVLHKFLHADLKAGKYKPGDVIPTDICTHKWEWWRLCAIGNESEQVDILWAYCEKTGTFFYYYPENSVDKIPG